jgi:hypothetical protein
LAISTAFFTTVASSTVRRDRLATGRRVYDGSLATVLGRASGTIGIVGSRVSIRVNYSFV